MRIMRRLLSTVIFCVMGLAVMAQSEVEPIVLDEITNVSMESASATARVSINPAGIENSDGDTMSEKAINYLINTIEIERTTLETIKDILLEK